MNEIYVIGHHNPDTDSIVSAMAYAALRNALGDRNYVAAHMDHISDQTQRMLDRFGFQPPRTVQNVRTQVEDLDYDTPPALNATVTMDRAWHIMREQKISAIPVINEDGTLYGTLSAGDIATYSMTTIANPRVEAVPLFNLLSVIEGRLLNDSGDLIDTVSGNVVIALPQSCENLLFGDPDNIVICGDQPDMIRRALDIGVSCLILCQTEVDPDLLENAGRTCIITTPYEASRVARLIYQASPISRPCHNEKIVCFHLSDYIDDVREVVLKSRYRCYPVLDENEKVVGTLSRYHLLRPRRKRVVLVDHNERAQAVPGLDQAEILEIIDHHRLADIQTSQPIRVRNEPVGSTATIIAGILLIFMGLFKLGALIRFVPFTITTGFTAGIAVTLTLGSDGRYTEVNRYCERPGQFTDSGRYTVRGNILTLRPDSPKDIPAYYRVGENRLWRLDSHQQPITGPFADQYILTKSDSATPAGCY